MFVLIVYINFVGMPTSRRRLISYAPWLKNHYGCCWLKINKNKNLNDACCIYALWLCTSYYKMHK